MPCPMCMTVPQYCVGVPAPQSNVPFQPSATFAGARPGFFFGMGDKGLGYYRDAPLVRALDFALTCCLQIFSLTFYETSSPIAFALQEQRIAAAAFDPAAASAAGAAAAPASAPPAFNAAPPGHPGGKGMSRLERIQAEQAARHRSRAEARQKEEVDPMDPVSACKLADTMRGSIICLLTATCIAAFQN